jgi:hypothetical protein
MDFAEQTIARGTQFAGESSLIDAPALSRLPEYADERVVELKS